MGRWSGTRATTGTRSPATASPTRSATPSSLARAADARLADLGATVPRWPEVTTGNGRLPGAARHLRRHAVFARLTDALTRYPDPAEASSPASEPKLCSRRSGAGNRPGWPRCRSPTPAHRPSGTQSPGLTYQAQPPLTTRRRNHHDRHYSTVDPVRNGVDTEALFATLDVVKGSPELAKFQFRASNTWLSGTHNRSTIDGYSGAGREMHRSGGVHLRRRPPAGAHRRGTTARPPSSTCCTPWPPASPRGWPTSRPPAASSPQGDFDREGDIDLLGILGWTVRSATATSAIRVAFPIMGERQPRRPSALLERSRRGRRSTTC